MKPKLAAFPKCFLDDLCVHKSMTLLDWIELAVTLKVDGLEFFSGFFGEDPELAFAAKERLAEHGLEMPMLCCSPDFTQPDQALLRREIDREIAMIELTAFFGGRYCRVLSGQRRPEIAVKDGVRQVVSVIRELLPVAAQYQVILTMENHYKDNYWQYPEFAQRMAVFGEIVDQIESPWFGINYDPSNTILAGEDPLELLERFKHRVVSMHASDRFLKYGTVEDLRREEDSTGYAARLAHGVIGQGMNDYDKIFSTLQAAGFQSWISIEDGLNGMEELRQSVRFLREKIDQHFPS